MSKLRLQVCLSLALIIMGTLFSVKAFADEKNVGNPPVIKGCYVSDNSLIDGYGKAKRYYVSAQDDEGLDHFAYSYDGMKTWKDTPNFLVKENGDHTVYVRDKDGNISEYTFYEDHIDNKGPYISKLEYCFDELCNDYGRYVKVNLTIADSGVGVGDMPISYDGEEFVSKFSRMYYLNGEYEVILKDRLGNIANCKIPIDCVDTKAPEIISKGIRPSVSINGYYYDATIYVVAMDEQSGLDKEAFSFDGGYSFGSINEQTVRENGKYRIVVKDGLKNEREDYIEVNNIDNSGPVIDKAELSLSDGNNGYGSTGRLYIYASDGESGMADTAYSFDGGLSYGADNNVEVNDNKTLNVCVMDALGNVTKEQYVITAIDKQPPSIVVSGNPTVSVNKDVTLKVSVSDVLSGINSVYFENVSTGKKMKLLSKEGANYSNDSVVINQNGTYRFYAYDCAGNEASQTVKVTKIIKNQDKPGGFSTGKIVIGGGSYSKDRLGVKGINLLDDSEQTIKSTTVRQKSEDDEEIEITRIVNDEILQEQDDGFDDLEPVLTPVINMDETTPTYIEKEAQIQQSKPEDMDLEIEYPVEEDSPNRSGGIVIATVCGVLLLLSLLVLIMYKAGFLEKVKIFGNNKEECND